MTEEVKLDQGSAGDDCPMCQKAAEETRQSEDTSMAFLLALVPVLALTFFGQVGLL